MSIKPILFSTPMVQAIIDGRKTMTRRMITNKDIVNGFDIENGKAISLEDGSGDQIEPERAAKYHVGDVLWVRETWRHQPMVYHRDARGYSDFEYQYRADFTPEEDECYGRRGGLATWAWRPSIFMPKEACRLFLRVTGVKAEWLQEITEEDALYEGISPEYILSLGIPATVTFVDAFAMLWDTLYAKRGYGWETNPWVWAYTFERCKAPEGWPNCERS